MKFLNGLVDMDNSIIIKKNDFLEEISTIKFTIELQGVPMEGFVVSYNGNYYAYINKCKHLNVELDWQPNEFFEEKKKFIICATHGALYKPDTGECIAGPCLGSYLKALKITETDNVLKILA